MNETFLIILNKSKLKRLIPFKTRNNGTPCIYCGKYIKNITCEDEFECYCADCIETGNEVES
jgi:hypothetical protein